MQMYVLFLSWRGYAYLDEEALSHVLMIEELRTKFNKLLYIYIGIIPRYNTSLN